MANSLANGLVEYENTKERLKNASQSIMETSAARSILSSRFFSYMRSIKLALNRFNVIKTTPGMAQYAKDQYDDQALSIGAQFTALVAAMETVKAWPLTDYPDMVGNVPQDGAYVDGELTDRLLTTVELADFRVQVQTLIIALG